MTTPAVPVDQGPPADALVRMAHACVQWLADRAGVRLLHIKGQALDDTMRARRHGGTDVDVLVAPEDVTVFKRQLEHHGWTLITSFRSGSVFGHAATLYHPVWGTTDLHRWIPGLDLDPATSFEVLWQSRSRRVLGGVECAVPGDDDHRLVLLLHAVRNGALGGVDFQLGWGELTTEWRHRIRRTAFSLGAHVPFLLATTDEAFVPGRRAHLWAAVVRGRSTTDQWGARFRDVTSPRELVALLREAVHANREHLELSLGRPATPVDTVRDQARRITAVAHWIRRVSGLSRDRAAQAAPGRVRSRSF